MFPNIGKCCRKHSVVVQQMVRVLDRSLDINHLSTSAGLRNKHRRVFRSFLRRSNSVSVHRLKYFTYPQLQHVLD